MSYRARSWLQRSTGCWIRVRVPICTSTARSADALRRGWTGRNAEGLPKGPACWSIRLKPEVRRCHDSESVKAFSSRVSCYSCRLRSAVCRGVRRRLQGLVSLHGFQFSRPVALLFVYARHDCLKAFRPIAIRRTIKEPARVPLLKCCEFKLCLVEAIVRGDGRVIGYLLVAFHQSWLGDGPVTA